MVPFSTRVCEVEASSLETTEVDERTVQRLIRSQVHSALYGYNAGSELASEPPANHAHAQWQQGAEGEPIMRVHMATGREAAEAAEGLEPVHGPASAKNLAESNWARRCNCGAQQRA